MNKATLAMLALALAMCCPAVPLAHAQGNSDHHKQHGNPHANKAADDGWQQREGWEYRTYGPQDGHPPGWSHGKKTGWGNCGLPPGQAKKYGCYTYSYQGQSYYYYQEPEGQIVVRRPIIDIDVNIH
jgi:hypothetical protein